MHICYLCSSDNTEVLGDNLDFHTDMYICLSCGLIQSDFVSGSYLKQYYAKAYRENRHETVSADFIDFMRNRAKNQTGFIFSGIPRRYEVRNVADIGAGAGCLLDAVRDRLDDKVAAFYAVEQDEQMQKYLSAKEYIKLKPEETFFSDDSAGKYSLITMSHVFEHINSPQEYVYRLHKIIASGGYLFIEVPHEPEQVVRHHINKKKTGIGHLFGYTPDILTEMICGSGLFESVKLETFGIDVDNYIKGGSLRCFERNIDHRGVYICGLFRKKDVIGKEQYSYIDGILRRRYDYQAYLEKRIESVKLDYENSAGWYETKAALEDRIQLLNERSERQHGWIQAHKRLLIKLESDFKNLTDITGIHKEFVNMQKTKRRNLQRMLEKKNEDIHALVNSKYYKAGKILFFPFDCFRNIVEYVKRIVAAYKDFMRFRVYFISDWSGNRRLGSECSIHNMAKEDKSVSIVYACEPYGSLKLLMLALSKKHMLINGIRVMNFRNVAKCIRFAKPKLYIHETSYVFKRVMDSSPKEMKRNISLMKKCEILCVSKMQQDYFRETYGIEKSKVIYECIPRQNTESYKNPYSEDLVNIVMVGSIQHRKGVDLFSQVADLAAKEGLNWRFHWVGNKVGQQEVYMSEKVIWHGYRSDPIPYMEHADLLFLSSVDDPFPLTCLECLQVFTGIVVYKEVGSAEIIDGISGCAVFREYTVDSALNALKNAMSIKLDKERVNFINNEISSIEAFKSRIYRIFR